MNNPPLPKFVQTLRRPIGKSERQRSRLHMLDWLACVAAGRLRNRLAQPERATLIGIAQYIERHAVLDAA